MSSRQVVLYARISLRDQAPWVGIASSTPDVCQDRFREPGAVPVGRLLPIFPSMEDTQYDDLFVCQLVANLVIRG